MNIQDISYIGIDVSKRTLDLATTQKYQCQLDNTPSEHKKLAKRLAKQPNTMVAVEATGGYERQLVQALIEADVKVAVAQPACVRFFAKSRKLHAKTDKIDAQLIAQFAQANNPKPQEKPEPDAQELRALRDRREQIVEDRVREQNRLEACANKKIATEIRRSIKRLEKQEQQLDEKIQKCINDSKELSPKAQVIQKPKGIGTQVTCTLLSHLPELGKVNRQKIAALVGLAPYACESGKWKGKRRIYGGRAAVRKAMFMAAMSAVQYDPVLKEFYQHKVKEGKLKKVALIAVARKLLVRINTMVAELENDQTNN